MLKFNRYQTDLFILLTLLIAGLKLTDGLENFFDVILYDESDYLWRGVKLISTGFPRADWAPLYAVWYYFLSLVEPERVVLYYLNFKLSIILPSLLIYVLLRLNQVSIPISVGMSWLILGSHIHVETWPRVSHFALLITLLLFILLSQTKTVLSAILLATIGALLVSYVRPEYFLTCLLSFFLLISSLVVKYKSLEKTFLTKLAVGAAVVIIFLIIIGIPFGHRSMDAFAQHFSRNWVSWTGSNLNPWTEANQIISLNFGTADSPLAALVNNPTMFLKHLSANFYNLVTKLPTVFFSSRILATDNLAIAAVVLLIVSLYFVYAARVYRNIFKYKWLWVFMGLYLLPGLVSAILITPWEHYLLLPGTLIMVMATILVASHPPETPLNHQPPWPIYVFLIIALTPSPFANNVGSQENLKTIRFIKNLKIQQPVNLLEAEGGYNIYLGDNFHRVAEYEKNENFGSFATGKNINMIVLSSLLVGDSRFRNDPEWQVFPTNFPNQGYTLLDIPNTSRKLLVQRSLLH